MKANELRIGNFIMFGELRHTCKHFDIGNLYESELINKVPSGSYRPIELTEEWLLKFEFEKLNRDIPAYEKNNLIVEWLFERWVGRLYYDCDNSVQIIELKFVHQLQNLYFALTGEELKA